MNAKSRIYLRDDLRFHKICQFSFTIRHCDALGASGAYHSLVAMRSVDAFTPALPDVIHGAEW